jgi:hypothetical protein
MVCMFLRLGRGKFDRRLLLPVPGTILMLWREEEEEYLHHYHRHHQDTHAYRRP